MCIYTCIFETTVPFARLRRMSAYAAGHNFTFAQYSHNDCTPGIHAFNSRNNVELVLFESSNSMKPHTARVSRVCQ